MTHDHNRTFVGFGFGPIQAGLFLHGALQSGRFARLVVAHRRAEMVEQIRAAGNFFHINIAHADRVEQVRIGPIVVLDIHDQQDRQQLVHFISEADEIATAISDVDGYVGDGAAGVHALLAQGLRHKAEQEGPPAVIYASENHNHAAQILRNAVLADLPENQRQAVQKWVRFLNTVIGKMSGRVHGLQTLAAHELAPVVPGADWGFLVEEFDHILIDRVRFEPLAFQRSIIGFEEKSDLRPFEEAKLYGHNATHALAAYVGALTDAERIADLRKVAGMMEFLAEAFLVESGGALVRKHADVDPLFTPAGYHHYVHDLLARMTNPLLLDTIERVGRDPARKLGWHDRLIGVMRLALSQRITPRRFAVGAAAALLRLQPDLLDSQRPAAELLHPLWTGDIDGEEQAHVLTLVDESLALLRQWQRQGRPPLLGFLGRYGTIT